MPVGTHGPGLTGASGIPEARRAVGSGGVDAFTPMSEGMDWTRGGQVSRYSPIMDGQPSQSPAPDIKDARDGCEAGVDFAPGS